jgi:hypothetical protein
MLFGWASLEQALCYRGHAPDYVAAAYRGQYAMRWRYQAQRCVSHYAPQEYGRTFLGSIDDAVYVGKGMEIYI